MTVNDDMFAKGSSDPGATGTQVADGGAVVTTMPANRVAGVVRVNLLPPEIAEEAMLRKVQVGTGLAIAAAAAIVGLLWYQQSSNLSDAKAALAHAQTDNARLKAEQAQLGNVDALFKQVDAANAMLKSASDYEIHMSSYLDELSLRQPQNIYFTTVSIAETPGAPLTTAAAPAASAAAGAAPASLGTVSISGVGYKHADVASWLDSFSQMTGVTGVYLTSSQESLVGDGANQVPTVTWSSNATLTLAALASQTDSGAGQ